MISFWTELSTLGRVLLCIACPATLILLLQTVLLIVGLGGDADTDADGVPDTVDLDSGGVPDGVDLDNDGVPDIDEPGEALDAGLRMFSVRGVIAFFTVFGWSGLALLRGGTSPTLSVALGVVFGVLAMLLTALLLRGILRLQENGSQSVKNAIGVAGSVYLTIPPARTEHGKVSLLLQGRLTECDAVTDDERPIKTGAEVVAVGVTGGGTLVVRRK